MNQTKGVHLNRATLFTTSVLGSLIAVSGFHHGIFEILQGNISTEFNIIQSIGPEYQRWQNGQEVFTLIPNYLITGIVAVITSIIIIAWSVGYMHTQYGPAVFFILFVFLTLIGGGIIHILFYLPIWLFSHRIRRPISWRKEGPSEGFQRFLIKSWIPAILLTSVTFISALELSVFGIAGLDENQIISWIVFCIFTALLSLIWSFVSAFTRDIRKHGAINGYITEL